ncbi:MAG: hypothetical protein VB062_02110 [Christensenella sp.]|nr:hypothetical protein [Christensenella sp.]
MQVFYPSQWVMILLFIAIWAVVPLLFALLCLRLPNRLFEPDCFFWRSFRWEKGGKIYDQVFHIRRWKHLLPDGGGVLKKQGYHKRNLTDYSEENLHRFLIEASRGELTHWLGILSFWVFGLFAPPSVIWMMLLYALLVNLPCIIAQRFNRPRIYAFLRLGGS